MELVRGRQRGEIDRPALEQLVAPYADVWLDVGTGSGLFAYDAARRRPDIFAIGLDANRDNLRELSAKALRKPARGGLPNVLFVAGSAESLPAELMGLAGHVWVNFPWGSLLRGLVMPDDALLAGLRRCAREGATLSLLLNFTVFGDQALAETLELPPVDLDYLRRVLAPAYARAGFHLTDARVLAPGAVPVRSAWGRRLTVGGTRETLQVQARAGRPGEAQTPGAG